MEEQLETKQEVTKKFTAGIVLIITSLALGKLILIPLILFPGSATWRTSMIIVYAFAWVLLIPGIWLAGIEGYRLVTHKYKHYKRRTVHHVKNGTKKAAQHTARVARRTGHATKKAASKTKHAGKKASKKKKHKSSNYKHRVLKGEKKLLKEF